MATESTSSLAIPHECEACGAPLVEHASRRYMVCQHCDTIYFLDSNVTAEEGVQLLNRYAQAHCGDVKLRFGTGELRMLTCSFVKSVEAFCFTRVPFRTLWRGAEQSRMQISINTKWRSS